MVLVILGTQDKCFDSLLKMVSQAKKDGLIKEEVKVQGGCTKYTGNDLDVFDYTSPSKLKEMMKEASYVICHGGVGSILDALKLKKKVIAVARRCEYKEHTNNHQLQIIKEFSTLGYIIDGSDNLDIAIKKLSGFEPKTYQSNNQNFINLLNDYIAKN